MNIASIPSDIQEEKLGLWLTEYGDEILRMCYLYLGDRTLAEDALQDTFVKVWRNMNRFEGRSSSKTWIMRIAINTCKDYRRTAWLRNVDRSKAVEDLPLAFHDVTEEARTLYEGVKSLPPKYKQVILLYHFQDLTMAETGDALGVSRATVQNRLQKAYDLLRYDPEGSDSDEV